MSIDPQAFGRLQAEVEQLQADADEIKKDLKQVLETLAQAKGSWKTLMMVAGASSAIGAFGVKVLGWIVHTPLPK